MTFTGIFTAFLGVLGVLLGGMCAYLDRFLTVGQMRRRPIGRGLPFIAHGGMWGDLLIVTPLSAIIVSRYSNGWSGLEIAISALFGIAVSVVMHWLYAQNDFPESHIEPYRHRLSAAGKVHVVYMAAALAIMFLFYFSTRGVSPAFGIAASALLAIHMVIGTHIPLGLWNPWWYGRVPDRTAYVTVGVVCALLAWRTYAIVVPR